MKKIGTITLIVLLVLVFFPSYSHNEEVIADVLESCPEIRSFGVLPDSIYVNTNVAQTQSGVVMHDFYGDIELTTRSINTGSYKCDITCEFTYTDVNYTHLYWRVIIYDGKVHDVWLDGKKIKPKLEEDDGLMWISTEIDEDFEYGEHSMRFVYSVDFEQSNPDNTRYQCFVKRIPCSYVRGMVANAFCTAVHRHNSYLI